MIKPLAAAAAALLLAGCTSVTAGKAAYEGWTIAQARAGYRALIAGPSDESRLLELSGDTSGGAIPAGACAAMTTALDKAAHLATGDPWPVQLRNDAGELAAALNDAALFYQSCANGLLITTSDVVPHNDAINQAAEAMQNALGIPNG